MERPKRNSQKLPDPDFVCTWSDMCSYKRMTSPLKSASKKIKLDTKDVEKPGNDVAATKEPDVTKEVKDKTFNAESSKSSKKRSVKSPKRAGSVKLPKDVKSPTPKTNIGRESTNKMKSPRRSNTFKASALKIKLKSPKKILDVPKATMKSTPEQMPVSSTQSGKTPQQKLKKLQSPQKKVTTIDPGERQPCTRTGCPAKAPICFARVSKGCVGNGFTYRWYHLSFGEHICNMCFEWAYRREGKRVYSNWRKTWEANGQIDGSMRLFFADQFLPYWVRCTKPECGKWRQLSRETNFTAELVASYVCGLTNKKVVKDPCKNPEDLRAKAVYDSAWITGLSYTPYLQSSPAAPFLRRYYSDGVGLSPFYNHMVPLEPQNYKELQNGFLTDPDRSSTSDSDTDAADVCANRKVRAKTGISNGIKDTPIKQQYKVKTSGCLPYLQPFYQPGTPAKALDFNPDFMSVEEKQLFPKYSKCQQNYLALRNIVIALWNLNCKEWLTREGCASHVLQRGLVRIKSVMDIDQILNYLTMKGCINSGLVPKPQNQSLMSEDKEYVIVIGAGAAGLSAAHHLNRMGIRVTVLEARDRLGGRIHDEHLGDVCVGKGAQIVVGSVNNPIMVMAHQAGLGMRVINDQCDLYDETGRTTDANTDKRIDYHFNAMLDNVADWRQRSTSKKDVHLLAKICETHRKFVEESKLPFTEQEERLLQFHISNLEYACGCDLTGVSAKNWDQNETYPQFAGKHMMVTGGYSELFNKMADELDVRLNSEVTQVQYDDTQVTVMLPSGETITGTKAIITLPLALLKQRAVFFEPPLPPKKIKAIEGLGAGIIEKIALRFPTRFWGDRTKDADCIGHVPASEETRGLFAVFYDLSPKKDSGPGILKSFVSGNGVRVIKQRSDEEVVQMCVTMLGRMFPEKPIPPVESYFVSHWNEDKYAQMAYSYVPVGSSGALYEALAEPVKNKVFFAGEATNRQFPQSVTGAYMSGIREAYKILADINEHLVQKACEPKESKIKKTRRRSKSDSQNNVEDGKRSPAKSPKIVKLNVSMSHATPKQKSPKRASPTKRSSSRNQPQGNKRCTVDEEKPKTTSPVKKKGRTETPKVSTPKKTKVQRRKSKPTKRNSEQREQIVNEESPTEKRKGEHSSKEGDLLDGIVIKKEIIDEQFPDDMDIQVKKEVEDEEDGGLNGSFRVLGSLEFDLSQGSTIHLDDSGELCCETQVDDHHNDSHIDGENKLNKDLQNEQCDSLDNSNTSVENELENNSQNSLLNEMHDSQAEPYRDQEESPNDLRNGTSQNHTQNDMNDSLQNEVADNLDSTNSQHEKCLPEDSNLNCEKKLEPRKMRGEKKL